MNDDIFASCHSWLYHDKTCLEQHLPSESAVQWSTDEQEADSIAAACQSAEVLRVSTVAWQICRSSNVKRNGTNRPAHIDITHSLANTLCTQKHFYSIHCKTTSSHDKWRKG